MHLKYDFKILSITLNLWSLTHFSHTVIYKYPTLFVCPSFTSTTNVNHWNVPLWKIEVSPQCRSVRIPLIHWLTVSVLVYILCLPFCNLYHNELFNISSYVKPIFMQTIVRKEVTVTIVQAVHSRMTFWIILSVFNHAITYRYVCRQLFPTNNKYAADSCESILT